MTIDLTPIIVLVCYHYFGLWPAIAIYFGTSFILHFIVYLLKKK